MTLSTGTRLGPYELLTPIGAGGMGEVYRAVDTRLGRVVAVKVLLKESSGRDARARFEREARAVSSLNHPNICTLFDVGAENGLAFLVMEYVEGETLAARLRRGPLPLASALKHSAEIAAALDRAHRAGIVHRDLKPSNVMLTSTGAKLLDFGVAKLRDSSVLSAKRVGSSANTETDPRTAEGAMVGTPRYMAPEQLERHEADARSDIFALGVLLYEMLTGRRAFEGDSGAGIIAAILTAEPPLASQSQPLCSPALDHLIKACLAKDPDERWQSAHDVLVQLKWLSGEQTKAPPVFAFVHDRSRSAWAVATAVLVVATAFGVSRWNQEEDPLPRVLPRQVTIGPGWEAEPALSPDGGSIAYSSDEGGNADVWVIDVHGGNALRLTDDPASDRKPAWFPDGSALAFVSERGQRTGIWKVPRLGGGATLLVSSGTDPAVSPDGKLLAFAAAGPRGEYRITAVPLADPTRKKVLTSDGDGLWDHRHPAWSSDGRWICYEAKRDLWVIPGAGGKSRRLTADNEVDIEPAWAPDGRHVYFSSFREGTSALWRVMSKGGSAQRLTLGTGPERHVTVSRDGRRLAYSTLMESPDLVLLDTTTGAEMRIPGLRDEKSPALSPDGRSMVFVSDRLGSRFELWLQPLVRGRPTGSARRLTDHPGSVSHPSWSADSTWIAYYRVIDAERDIWIVPAAGGPSVRFTDDSAADVDPAWSPDGTQIAFASERGGGSDIWVAPVAAGHPAGPARRLTTEVTTDLTPAWSPDGGELAYVGRATNGDSEVWIVRASQPGAARRITTAAHAGRVAWDRRSKGLLVSGRWGGPSIEVRRVDPANGTSRPFARPVFFGQSDGLADFDVSWDGRTIAFAREDLRGDVWMLEAQGRSY